MLARERLVTLMPATATGGFYMRNVVVTRDGRETSFVTDAGLPWG